MIGKMNQQYSDGFFYMFLGVALIVIFTIFASKELPMNANTVVLPSGHAAEPPAKGFTMPATTGFVIGIVGGGTVIMITGWHLSRNKINDWADDQSERYEMK